MTEKLIVFGACCVWWDSIDKVSTNGGLPCCPFCGGVLFQINEEEWNSNVAKHEKNNHPGYSGFISWLRGKCFETQEEAEAAFKRPN